MKRFMKLVAIVASSWASCAALAQDSPANYTQAEYAEFVRSVDFPAHTIDPAQFLKLRDQENTIVLDLRSLEDFNRRHIVGALHLGPNILESRLKDLASPTDTILLYCTNSLELTRRISLTNVSLPQLLALGYENTFILEDTVIGAKTAGIPMTQ